MADTLLHFINISQIFLFIVSILFGIFFLVKGLSRQTPVFLLGIFILIYNGSFFTSIVRDNNLFEFPDQWRLLPIYFGFLEVPLLLFYLRKITFPKLNIKDYLLLIPAVIEFFMFLFFFLNFEYSELRKLPVFNIMLFTHIFFNLALSLLGVYFLTKHYKKYKQKYSRSGKKQILFFKTMLASFSIYTILMLNFILFDFTNQVRFLLVIFHVSMTFAVIYSAFTTQNIACFLRSTKNSRSLSKNEMEVIVDTAMSFLISSEKYLEKDFLLPDLYSHIQIAPHKISLAFNTILNRSFNSLINSLRVEKAKIYLKDNKYDQYKIEVIGNEVGFKSKSIFYKTFKQETGITPLKYKTSKETF